MAHRFFCARVDDRKSFSAGRVDPFVVDEQLGVSHKYSITYIKVHNNISQQHEFHKQACIDSDTTILIFHLEREANAFQNVYISFYVDHHKKQSIILLFSSSIKSTIQLQNATHTRKEQTFRE